MKTKIIKLFVLFVILCFNANSFAVDSYRKIKVSVTSSHIYSLLKEICGDKLELTLIVSPVICPNTNDIDAAMLKKVSTCNIVIYHYWQPWAKSLKNRVANLSAVYKELKTEGNLMIPYINVRAAEEITEMFGYLDPPNKNFYEQNLVKYIFRIRHLEEQISKRARLKYNGKKIVCNNKVADFMQWLGCDVVAEYGKPEDVSSAQMLRISKKIKDNKVKFIIDNLQSGTDIGKTLSKDLKKEQVVISNFPLNYSYIETLKDNVLKLDKVLQ